jgi:hypothetical protein
LPAEAFHERELADHLGVKAVAAVALQESGETEAFELGQRAKPKDAWQLLNGARYRASKHRYDDVLRSFIAHLDDCQQVLLAQARAETQAFVALAATMALVILLLFVAGGWVTLRSLRRV